MPSITRSALSVAALTMLMAGCTTNDDPNTASVEPTETATRPTPSLTETTTPSETPTPTPTPTATPPRSLYDRLVPSEELPWFNTESSWRTVSTEPTDPEWTSPCGGFGLLSIGAMEVVHRAYLPVDGSDAEALEIVGAFPDVVTAKRAYSVLGSDYQNCPKDHDGDPEVGPFQMVAFENRAAGGWHLLTYGTTFDAHGFIRRGKYIAQVILTLREAQDYNYEAGQEPMVEALARAAAHL
ncbi:MAG TPA: hypothetical protein VLI04_03540 [Nocardioidaceae bacterium]|nr:hypothetical protein [Nocardioidaceae bacterium]